VIAFLNNDIGEISSGMTSKGPFMLNGLQAFENVYPTLRRELLEDPLLGDQPLAAKAWLSEVHSQTDRTEFQRQHDV
jgi:hypothetical protein